MSLYKSDKVRFIAGLLFIIVIYSCYHLFFENEYFAIVPKIVVPLFRFLTTVAVYFIGTLHLGKLKDKWMASLWHIVHISGLCIITSLGLIDWFIVHIALYLRDFALTIQEILISPVLYVAMGLLNRSLKKPSTA